MLWRNTQKIIALLIMYGLFFPASAAYAGDREHDPLTRIKKQGYISWGADAEGGAPYIFPDPKDPSRLIGFEVDLADALARELGVTARHRQNAWDALIPALERGDFDIAMNGIEITPQRKGKVLFSKPYYMYVEQLVVRRDETRIQSVNELTGKSVGTLSGTVAQHILANMRGVDIRVYPGQVEPYEDLALGRIDAVLLDLPIAAYYAKPNPKLKFTGETVGEGFYGIAVRRDESSLRDRIDQALDALSRRGELKRIYEKWNLWDSNQEKLFSAGNASGFVSLEETKQVSLFTLLPMLLKGAAVTIGVSVLSMSFAIVLGMLITLARLYASRPVRLLAGAYVEVYRGTPLLIQLYILYYGLPNIGISLSPMLAAFLGLGMNYAAYESELYRAGIAAIPKGQIEAAQSLGMRRRLIIRRIVMPQALRIALPGVTNDFIALFKDSSIVSIIAMVELTKTYSILAATTLKFFELGIVVAFLYFIMSYPLSRLARRLERSMKRSRH